MKFRTSLLVTLLAFFLSGCKGTLLVKVKLSELISDTDTTQLDATILSEVPSCKDYENPENISSYVLEAKQKAAYFMPNSEYLGCQSQDYSSYAYFSVPFGLDKTRNQKAINAQQAQIYSYHNEGVFAYIAIPETIRNRITESINSDPLFDGLDVIFLIERDVDVSFPISIHSAYLATKFPKEQHTIFTFAGKKVVYMACDSCPFIDKKSYDYVNSSYSHLTIKLSNVSVDKVLSSDGNHILIDPFKVSLLPLIPKTE